MARPETDLPTIIDYHEWLTELIEQGYGYLPVQVLVAPDSTMQAIARGTPGAEGKPALLIERDGKSGRINPVLVSTERLQSEGGMKSILSN